MNDRKKFYLEGVKNLIPDGTSSILVCGGGDTDKDIFEKLGFADVTISNLDTRMVGNEFAPFRWEFANAEALPFENGSFDYVVIHAAIHHSFSPHKVLLEMYRVAKKGVLTFESRDSAVMKFLVQYNLTPEFEHAAVYFNNCEFGGADNTDIPNYVFRWTENEVEKTIKSYAPYFPHKFVYRYGSDFPRTAELENKNQLKSLFITVMKPFYFLFALLFPRQQNLFAFYVEKPSSDVLFPWLIFDKNENRFRFNKEWGNKMYKNDG